MSTSPARALRRMNLSAVTTGRIEAPLRVLLMGVPGVGKSTFAASCPAPIYLGAEDGTNSLDVARFPTPQSWEDVLDAVRTLAAEKHDYRTLVVDTLDSLEPICWRAVVGRDRKATSIEEVGGGYGKGFAAAVDEWRVFISELERLRAAGMNAVLLAHCWVMNYKNPAGPDFDRFVMKLEKRAGAAFSEWVDAHLFAQFEGGAKEERGKRAKGWSSDARVVHTRRTAAWDAKNRYDLPETMPLSWEEFAAAVQSGRAPEAIRKRIEEALAKLEGDDATKARAALVRASDGQKLAQLENWILTRMPRDKEEV